MLLSQLLPIKYPIVQAPMLGVTTPAMVAAIAELGGLGSLPLGGLSPSRTAELIRLTKDKTDKPFAVNLFTHDTTTTVAQMELDGMQDLLRPLHQELNIPFEPKALSDFTFHSYKEQLDILVAEQVPVVSFTFGLLEAHEIDRLKRAGCKLIGTATSVREAILLDQRGVDSIVVQGIEAGGHRGSFLAEDVLPQVGLMALLPQAVDAVSVPVIAAGGLFDDRTIKAAFVLGAAGVQLGSVFLASDESAASAAYKEAVLGSSDTSSALTKAFTGRWARGIKNSFMNRVEQSGISIPYYTYQNSLTATIRRYGQEHNQSEFISLWAGQSAGRSRRGKTSDIFLSLVSSLPDGL